MLRSIRLVGEIQAVEMVDGRLMVTMNDQTLEFPVGDAPAAAPARQSQVRRPRQTNGHATTDTASEPQRFEARGDE